MEHEGQEGCYNLEQARHEVEEEDVDNTMCNWAAAAKCKRRLTAKALEEAGNAKHSAFWKYVICTELV